MRTAPQLIQYQGSKRRLAPQILQYFPLGVQTLWEPFAGMAAISIAAAQRNLAVRYHLNDVNSALVKILQAAIETPDSLSEEYAALWEEQFHDSEGDIHHFYVVREAFNHSQQSAVQLLYLLARCVKGSVRYGRDGKFNQSPDKRRHGTAPDILCERIRAISFLLKGKTTFSALDYREVLEQARPGDLVYMDPPYQGVSEARDKRYVAGVALKEFSDALEILNRKGVDFLVSYDGSCGDKSYGQELPPELECKKILLTAGYSSQAILLGKKEITREALYLSKNLAQKLSLASPSSVQLEFPWEEKEAAV